MVAAGLLHRRAALVGEDDEDRAAVVVGADAADEAGLLESVDDAGEAALAVEDPLGELVHAQAVGCLLEVDEDVVPAQRDAGVALELGVEHVDECERALEVEAPRAQPLGEGLDRDCSSWDSSLCNCLLMDSCDRISFRTEGAR